MPENVVDILENDFSPEILAQLLRDHTTGRNILWCTHDYESNGAGYQFADEILPKIITGEHGTIIRLRVLKSKSEQSDREKDMAEVFTPSWVVKMMVDYVNIEVNTPSLELTCGEAPFLVSRYDATTGEPIAMALRKCPQLVIAKPDFKLYSSCSKAFKDICRSYAPVVEEFIFRKFLIDRVYRYGEWVAILTSGLMFGLFHENLAQFFFATLIGCFFAFFYILRVLRLLTGKLWVKGFCEVKKTCFSFVLRPFLCNFAP